MYRREDDRGISKEKETCLENSANNRAKTGSDGITSQRSLRKKTMTAHNHPDEVQLGMGDDHGISNDGDLCLEITSNDTDKAGCNELVSGRSFRKRKRKTAYNHEDEVQVRVEDDHGKSNNEDVGLEISSNNTANAGCNKLTSGRSSSKRKRKTADEV